MITEILAIAAGFVLLTWSADRFVVGASAVAWNLNISPLIIGLTIVSLGTSAPEIIVSGMAAWQGNAGLAVGNVIGSNIINTALILGITALIMPLNVHSSIVKRELPVLLLVMGFVLLLIFDGTLGLKDGMLLLAGMVAVLAWITWVGMTTRSAGDPMGEDFADEIPTQLSMGKALLLLLLGSVLLLASSRLLVWGAVSVAHTLGVSDLVIGLTIVALGTSLPELAASVMSALKNEHDIAIGNIIGSNMYNLLAVLCLPGLLDPGPVDRMVLIRDYPVLIGLTLAMFIMAYGFRGPGRINRVEGGLLVAGFAAYQTLLYFSEVMPR
ncbi:MAG: calcium/sodium antiporter [Gammaproteobacteria bacterium]|nr:calcium/sodium antiporter [Gammaproteobacteria bacterium]MDH5513684.1 calcium/sodium antiporter [Gammaproteobacteria bacterium]